MLNSQTSTLICFKLISPTHFILPLLQIEPSGKCSKLGLQQTALSTGRSCEHSDFSESSINIFKYLAMDFGIIFTFFRNSLKNKGIL